MTDDYLKTFDNLFFDMDENDEIKSIIEQASSVLASIITRYGEIENEISFGSSRQDDFIDVVVCLFVRKIMEQLDAINVLFSIASFTQAQVILRSLIENIVSLEFILKEDTEKRAAAYYLEHHYQEIELGKEYFDKNSESGKLIAASRGEAQLHSDYEKYKKKEEAFQRLIHSEAVFQKVDKARSVKLNNKKKRTGKKKVHIQWYEVCSDVSSFYGLMKETGYEKYYQGIYGGLSFETHALNSTMEMNAVEEGIRLKWIRNPEGGGSTFSLACTFSISALHKIYQYLKDGEEEKREFKSYFMDFRQKRDIAAHNLDMIKGS